MKNKPNMKNKPTWVKGMPKVNDFVNEESTIERCPHDSSTRYSVVDNNLIRDPSISPACCWLIIYLLSNQQGWRINITQIASYVKKHMGRDKVRSLFAEAMEAGYIKREEAKRPNPRGGYLRIYKYFISETPKFKKFYRCTEIQDAGDPHAGHQETKEVLSEEVLLREYTSLKVSPSELKIKKTELISTKAEKSHNSKEHVPAEAVEMEKKKIPQNFPQEVKDVCSAMNSALQQAKPDYPVPKNLTPLQTLIDFMIRLDKRSPQKILDVFRWALADSFWADKMFKPNPAKYLREKFDQLEMKMNAKVPQKDRKFAPSSNDDAAFEKIKEMRSRAL